MKIRILATSCLLLLASTTHAQDADIGVRTKVMDKDLQWSHKSNSPEEGGHSKIYGILSVQEIKSDQRLVKPVNEDAMLQLLSREMNANGFKLYAPGTKPEIVLTVSYGRGLVQNPYLKGSAGISGSASVPTGDGSMTNSDDVPTSTIEGAFATQLIDEKTPGFQSKLQKATFEKLYIRVTAWAYPSDPKAKAKMLWKTVIVADDPDHRDLNAIAAEMLKAGAPYFDRDIKGPEVEFYHGVPQGQVSVGTPTVVQAEPKK